MELKAILLAHARTYPLMEPRDAVKLLYQNEFGGGHLIRDASACLEYLCREYDAVPQDPRIPLWEDIGNGMIRVNLAALGSHGLSIADLGQAFLRSAIAMGTLDSFQKKLSVLSALTAAGQMPFSREILENYLTEYQHAGFPMVSHSETYRSAYRPAYRVVQKTIFFHFFRQIP